MLRSAYDEKLSSYDLLVMPAIAAKAQAIPQPEQVLWKLCNQLCQYIK